MTGILADVTHAADQFISLGTAGLMGWMWLWERRTNRSREEQLDQAHSRILADGVQIDALLDTVRKATEVLARLSAQQEQLNHHLDREGK